MRNFSMRDAFFNNLYKIARKDKDVTIVSADMGAPSLDQFRTDLKGQFVNVGIAEHNMVTVATGLAMSGKKVFIYAIMPFVTSRCYEMIKVDLSLMNIPVTAVGVGAGFSYDDSGPTHHSTEDISIMRSLPNMTILNSSDSIMAGKFAGMACKLPGPSYVRLDRKIFPDIYNKGEDFNKGASVLKKGRDIWIIATGNMVHRAVEVSAELAGHSVNTGVIDLYRLKPVNEKLIIDAIKNSKGVVTIEEHLLMGGLGSIVAETLADNAINLPVKRIGIRDRYYYAYGGRDNIQRIAGLDRESIVQTILGWIKRQG